MRPKTETKSKSLSVRAALTLLLMLFATTSVWAKDYNYISDLKLIGGTQAEVAALKTTYTEAEWEVIDQNLNEGAVGDHIHLYYTRQLAATISENMVSLTSITINNTSDGALGKNGNDAAAYSLNNGTTGNSIYIPPTKELLGGSLKRVVTVEDVALKRSIIVVMES